MPKQEIAEEDLDEIRSLARRVGVAEERIDLLLLQAYGTDEKGDSGPRFLLVSAGNGTIDLLFSRWLGDEVAEAIRQAGARPLVIGSEPERIRKRPGMESCSVFHLSKFQPKQSHLVALVATGALSPRQLGELASAGPWDSAIVVTRASTPLPQAERELVRSLSKIVAVAKVLVIAVPGELTKEDDSSSVEQYARTKIEASGFSDGRCEGVWFWWIDRQSRHPQAVIKPDELLTYDVPAVICGRELILRNGLVAMLEEIEHKAKSFGTKSLVKLSDEDLRELDENFHRLMTGLRRKTEEHFADAHGATDAMLREFVIDNILRWDRADDLNGVWLTYVENVRLGAKAGLFERVKAVADVLSLKHVEKRTHTTNGSYSESRRHLRRERDATFGNTVSDLSGRVGVAVTVGILLWALTSALFTEGVIAAAAAAVGSIFGFLYGKPVVSAIRRLSLNRTVEARRPLGRMSKERLVENEVCNFALFERELSIWLNEHIRTETSDVIARCRDLIQRFNSDV